MVRLIFECNDFNQANAIHLALKEETVLEPLNKVINHYGEKNLVQPLVSYVDDMKHYIGCAIEDITEEQCLIVDLINS